MSEKANRKLWQLLPYPGMTSEGPELVLVQKAPNQFTGEAGMFISLKPNKALQYVLHDTVPEQEACIAAMRRYERKYPIKEVSLDQEGKDPRPPQVKPEVKIKSLENEAMNLKAHIAELEAALSRKTK